MSYDNYKAARDMAWKILLECGINTLPVRPSVVCEHYGWVLADYQTGASSIALLGLEDLTKQTDGLCAVTQNHMYIFFDSTLPAGRQLFRAHLEQQPGVCGRRAADYFDRHAGGDEFP